MWWSGWRSIESESHGRQGSQLRARARAGTVWQLPASRCWNWLCWRAKAEFDSASASSLSCKRSNLGSPFCQSAEGCVRELRPFPTLIPRIAQTALLEPRRWWKGYRCLPPTAKSAGRGTFARSGDNRAAEARPLPEPPPTVISSRVRPGLDSVRYCLLGAGVLGAGVFAGGGPVRTW